MNYRFRHILATLLLLPMLAWAADEFEVSSFEVLIGDLTAKKYKQMDLNGQPCALVKVYVRDRIAEASNSIAVVDKGLEKWVYLPQNTKFVKLSFGDHFPLRVTFDDYDIPALTGLMTYDLRLREAAGQSPHTVPTQPEKPQLDTPKVKAETIVVTGRRRIVKGKVVDAKDGEPLIGATVMLDGLQQGVATDLDGNFAIDVPGNVKAFNVSYVGYKKQRVPIEGLDYVTIFMK